MIIGVVKHGPLEGERAMLRHCPFVPQAWLAQFDNRDLELLAFGWHYFPQEDFEIRTATKSEAAEVLAATVAAMKQATEDMVVPGLTIVNDAPLVKRNDPCPCGSGAKFKKCCRVMVRRKVRVHEATRVDT